MNLLYLDIRKELSLVDFAEIVSESYFSTSVGYECSFYLRKRVYGSSASLFSGVDNSLREVCRGLKVNEAPLSYRKRGIITEFVKIYLENRRPVRIPN